MIEETVQVHDRYQFEIKTAYDLEPRRRTTTYDVETYVFLPRNLGVSRLSYSKQDFYNDIQTYIRLKTPAVLLRDVCSGRDSPLDRVSASIDLLDDADREQCVAKYERRLKLFGCIVRSALRDHVHFASQAPTNADFDALLGDYLEGVARITRRFRELRRRVNVPKRDPKVVSAFLFLDEYLSLQVEDYTYDLLEQLRGGNSPNAESHRRKLVELARSEADHRREMGRRSVAVEGTDNEEAVFRRGVLKKYVGNVLFLDTRVGREGQFLEQVLFGLAAGVAMLFTMVILFSYQVRYGSLSIPFFAAAVISYVFKDRMKEFIRIYLHRRLGSLLFDHKTSIYTRPAQTIGQCRESFDFVPERRVPSEVLRIRAASHMTEIENELRGERIMRYRKRLRLLSRRIRSAYESSRIEGINDIMRFNVRRFLTRMDDPKKPLFVADEEGYHAIRARRTYHVNLIIRFSAGGRSSYRRFRIVLSRSGIRRIDEVPVGVSA
ncbi:MAG TPA: hypothetical protein VM492_08400 [Sumerlaeia bacterium]|nr:hypothetical protein [Sumerlaeia bacterium]